jgi:predicted  nucleic acid-binding Zn-ribbon protein
MSENPIRQNSPSESHFSAANSEPILVEVIDIIPTSPNLVESELTTIPNDIKSNPDWFTIARKLRQQNRELMQTIVQLEKSLTDSRQELQNQKQRIISTETLVNQQGEERQKTQAQINHLVHELDAAHQTAQRQQLTNENLSEQLANTQEQFAQLQRECAFLQEECNEKTQKIMFFEQHMRELNARLHRQQRYTLQYKAALNQYLEIPITTDSEICFQSSPVVINQQDVSIPPWSSQIKRDISLAQPDSNLINEIETDDTLHDWLESLDFNQSETLDTVQENSVNKWTSHVISRANSGKKSAKIVDIPSFLRGRS